MPTGPKGQERSATITNRGRMPPNGRGQDPARSQWSAQGPLLPADLLESVLKFTDGRFCGADYHPLRRGSWP
jgi:hypothetical protein